MSPETKLDVSKADFDPGQRPPLSSANSLDLIIARDGKIAALYVFLDSASS